MAKSKTVRRLIKKAHDDNPAAMFLLGIRYLTGRGVDYDGSRAVLLISDSAAHGYEPAIRWTEEYYFDDNAATQAES